MARRAQAAAAVDDDDGAGFEDGSVEVETTGHVVDMSGVSDDDGFQPIPAGTYPVFVEQLEYGMSSKGNPMWTWRLRIEDGEYANRMLFYHSTFVAATLPRVKRDLIAIEDEAGRATELSKSSFDPQEIADEGVFLYARARAKVVVRMYQGEKRNSVQRLLAPAAAASDDDGLNY